MEERAEKLPMRENGEGKKKARMKQSSKENAKVEIWKKRRPQCWLTKYLENSWKAREKKGYLSTKKTPKGTISYDLKRI